MGNFKYCSACLVTKVKMFNLSSKPTSKSTYTLSQIFTRIIRIQTFENYNYVCYECASLAYKFQKFKSKCQKAQYILTALVEDDSDIVKEVIKSIDRQILRLSSKLGFSSMVITNREFDNETMALGNEVNTHEVPSLESVHTNVCETHDSEKINEPINEVQNFESNMEINQNIVPTMEEITENEVNGDTISREVEVTQRNDCDEECEMIEEYLESEEESLSNTDISESSKENSKDTNAILPTSENTEDSESIVATQKNNKVSDDIAFTNEDNCSSENISSSKDNQENTDVIATTKENNEDLNNLECENESNNEPKQRKQETGEERKITETKNIEDTSDLSDDEPLIKKLKDPENFTLKKGRKKFNAKFFEDYATVVLLTPEEAKKELLLRKESANYIVCPHKCDLCYKGFEFENAYENHKKKHTDENGSFECDLCHLRYPAKKDLRRHNLTCHKRKFICKLCPYTCFNDNQARIHVKLHKGKTYPCTDCGQIFSMPNSLLMHKRVKHQPEHVCDFCGDMFGSTAGLRVHKNKLHKREENDNDGPHCEQCDIHFANEMAWQKHMVIKHNLRNGCKHCGDVFNDAKELENHLKTHARHQSFRNALPKFPVNCELCKKTLSDNNEFKSHMTSKHPQSHVAKKLHKEKQMPFVCEVCGKSFKSRAFLRSHQRVHTRERPYSCAQCGATFAHPSALALHRAARHRRARDHACALCGQAFAARNSLNKHMKVHLNIRPHKCSLCEKTFIHPSDLKGHVSRVHDTVRTSKKKKGKRKTAKEKK